MMGVARGMKTGQLMMCNKKSGCVPYLCLTTDLQGNCSYTRVRHAVMICVEGQSVGRAYLCSWDGNIAIDGWVYLDGQSLLTIFRKLCSGFAFGVSNTVMLGMLGEGERDTTLQQSKRAGRGGRA